MVLGICQVKKPQLTRKLLLLAGLLITFSCIDEPCADVYDPVCTPDGTQYGNDCEARNAGVKEYTSCISWFKIKNQKTSTI